MAFAYGRYQRTRSQEHETGSRCDAASVCNVSARYLRDANRHSQEQKGVSGMGGTRSGRKIHRRSVAAIQIGRAVMKAQKPHSSFFEFFAGAGMARAGLGEGWQCLFANEFDLKKAV